MKIERVESKEIRIPEVGDGVQDQRGKNPAGGLGLGKIIGVARESCKTKFEDGQVIDVPRKMLKPGHRIPNSWLWNGRA